MPIWNAEVYGNVVLLIDEVKQELTLSSEKAATKKVGGAPIKGDWNASNVETLGKVIRFFEGQGYQMVKGSQWSPEGTDLANAKPVLKATKYAAPCIHWIAPNKAPGAVTTAKILSFSQVARILEENPGKAKPKRK
jgi:hypothetical protein